MDFWLKSFFFVKSILMKVFVTSPLNLSVENQARENVVFLHFDSTFNKSNVYTNKRFKSFYPFCNSPTYVHYAGF
jgi:hypothetical protein